MGERLTQTGIEGVAAGSPNVRSTQTAIEGVVVGSPNLRLTQVAIEVVTSRVKPPSGSAQFLSTIFPSVRGCTFPVMKTDEWDTTVKTSASGYEVRIPNMVNPIWHWTLIFDYLKNDPRDVVASLAPYTDYEVLRGFLLYNHGKYGRFLYNDPTDNWVGPYTWQPPAQPGLVGNYYPLNYVVIDPAGHAQKVTVPGVSGASAPTWNDAGGSTVDGSVIWTDLGAFPGSSAQQIPLVTDGTFYYCPLQRNFGGQFLEDVTDLNTSVNPLRIWANGNLIQNTAYQILGPGLTLPNARYYGAYVSFYPWFPFMSYSASNLFIDPAGHLQQATTTGLSGALSPAWNDSGGTTLDGSVLWQDLGPVTATTAAFNFYFRVRLESDSHDIEQFSQNLWTIGGQKSKNGSGMLQLQTARPDNLPPSSCEVYPWNL
jgi:hypothetical protein